MSEYDRALSMYQDTIFSDKLDWWSEALQLELSWLAFNGNSNAPTPIPQNYAEYFQLSAYARFRILLIHLIRGFDSDAQIVYNNLVAQYPPGNPGYPYVEMATAFWNEYQSSQDIGLACVQAVAYAAAHPEILSPLGNVDGENWHGIQSLDYEPGDVCPVKR